MKRLLLIIPCLLIAHPWLADARGSQVAEMTMVNPGPPGTNPHPPQTAEDQRRVNFAVEEIKAFYGPNVQVVHAHIIPWAWEKYQKNKRSEKTANEAPMVAPGGMAKPVQGPQLKPDEYMVHAYVKFPNDTLWYHVDVIMTEDDAGRLTRRDFFKMPIPYEGGHMPPGVVC